MKHVKPLSFSQNHVTSFENNQEILFYVFVVTLISVIPQVK